MRIKGMFKTKLLGNTNAKRNEDLSNENIPPIIS